jgi:hypothetical protein
LQATRAEFNSPFLHQFFPSGEQGARGCLLSRVEAGSIPATGATSAAVVQRRAKSAHVAKLDKCARLRIWKVGVRVLPCAPDQTGCSSVGRAPRLGRGGRWIVTSHPDQCGSRTTAMASDPTCNGGSAPASRANPRCGAESGRSVGLQNRERGFDSRPQLHALVAQRTERRSSTPGVGSSNLPEGAIFCSCRAAVRSPRRLSSPAKAGDPVNADFSRFRITVVTGSSAFARALQK